MQVRKRRQTLGNKLDNLHIITLMCSFSYKLITSSGNKYWRRYQIQKQNISSNFYTGSNVQTKRILSSFNLIQSFLNFRFEYQNVKFLHGKIKETTCGVGHKGPKTWAHNAMPGWPIHLVKFLQKIFSTTQIDMTRSHK